ncbi:MAG: hypothetical protein PVF74_14335 [Anaerolineales bacterium]|jgi:hypothetical protein
MAEWFSSIVSLFIDPDERFIMHRYYSSRLALAVGMILMSGFFFYEMLVNNQLRLDILITIAVMALTKVLAMAYYRIVD